jgi:hypothetical protein
MGGHNGGPTGCQDRTPSPWRTGDRALRGKRPSSMRWGDQLELSDEAMPGDFILCSTLRAASGDQCQPKRDLRSGGREGRTGSDCGESRCAHPRTGQCWASRHAVSPSSLRRILPQDEQEQRGGPNLRGRWGGRPHVDGQCELKCRARSRVGTRP